MPDPVRSIIKTGIHHHHQHKHHHHQNSASSTLVVGVASAGGTAGLMLLTLLVLLYRRLLRSKKTSPWQTAGGSIHRFSYKELKSATAGFSADNKLGHGGFGSVFRGHLRIAGVGTDVAVKVLEQHGTLQGEREFQTELSVMAKLAASSSSPSANVVGLLGFCVDKKRKKKVLVYEYMANRSLQEALFGDGKSGRVVLGWKTRLKVLGDTARALAFLHSKCDPAIIHGDVKPSNILLDAAMSARLADFGLARFHDRNALDVVRVDDTDDDRAPADGSESEDLTRRDFRSPESVAKFSSPDETGGGAAAAADDTDTATETHDGTAASETVDLATAKSAVTDDDGTSLASAEGVPPASSKRGAKKSASNPAPHARDWWWRQDGSGEMRVKDYVIEWISGEIRKDGADVAAAAGTAASKSSKSKSKRRESREWWREEYCQELSNKKQQRKKSRGGGSGRSLSMEWWRSDMEEDRRQHRMMKRSRSRSRSKSRSSRMSRDLVAADVLSSTPSMRGTVCYVAPEYGGGNVVSEKGDVYSFGVVILVVVAGRRPLQMAASPVMTELERANLISWARHLARSGNVLELVDRALADDDDDFDRSEALLLITLALLCLQRLPAARPSMSDVVNMLSGEMDVPALPVEFSPSPPYAVPFSRRRGAAGKAAPSPAPVDAAALTPTAAGLAS